MITYHPWYHNFQPQKACQCLAEAAELGARYIRIDVRWKDLLPDGHTVDEAAWVWYQNYLLTARNWYGLEPLIVLSNPPANVLQAPIELRITAWKRYVNEVALRAGTLCGLYQPLNEPNNPLYRIFPKNRTCEAITSAAIAIRESNPGAQVIINVLADLVGWQSDLEEILEECGTAINIVGLDYYPGTWGISSQSASSNWDRIVDIISTRRQNFKSILGGRTFAIVETGYSTNVRPWRGEQQQVNYFRSMEGALIRLDKSIGRAGLFLVGVHELADDDSNSFLDPEAHFGLLTSGNLKRKAGFDAVQQLFTAIQ